MAEEERRRREKSTFSFEISEPGEADLKNYIFDSVEKLDRISGIKNEVLKM